MSKKLDQLAKEHVMRVTRNIGKHYNPFPSVESFRAGYLARDKELRDAWPNVFPYGLINEIINNDEDVTEKESFAIDAMWRLHSWLKAKVLGANTE